MHRHFQKCHKYDQGNRHAWRGRVAKACVATSLSTTDDPMSVITCRRGMCKRGTPLNKHFRGNREKTNHKHVIQ